MDRRLGEWIMEADISEMQAEMDANRITSEGLVKYYIERIRLYDPKLRSVLELNPDALNIARQLDIERQEQGRRGPLHGIPILLKDNIGTGDKMHTSAGSLALAEHYASEDSVVAARLRAAGAVLLGKTNMTEWANFMSSSMWSGYSSRGGLVLNPYGPGELFVGGSSSGSAAAAAANLCAAAIGTETSGSIISPAGHTCLVGLKPTVGLVSRRGIIPLTYSQDSAGPMTRTVRDAAILLGVMAGEDESDRKTSGSSAFRHEDYTVFLDQSFVRKARIGIPRGDFWSLDKDRQKVIEAAIMTMRDLGAEMIDLEGFPSQETKWDSSVLRYEFKKYLNDYLADANETAAVRSLAEVIQYNEAHAELTLKYGQDLLIWCEQTSGTLSEIEYLEALDKNREKAAVEGIDRVINEYQLDAIMFLGDEACNDLAARAGYPALTVPGGRTYEGVITPGGYNTKGPQGITFVGTAFSEPVLFALAYAYEQASSHRAAPDMSDY